MTLPPQPASDYSDYSDYFGPQAADYLKYRPRYPQSLFTYLATSVKSTRLAWDCATGNGQAAVGLAHRFAKVYATDPSADMIKNAMEHPRVTYAVAKYETTLPDASVSLITVAQALHWFDINAFIKEARRVMEPDGVLAAFCYTRCRLDEELDATVDHFFNVTVGSYWPIERRLADDGYRTIALPLDEMLAPPCEMIEQWNLNSFLRFVRTWSAVGRCIAARGEEPVTTFESELRSLWGPPETKRRIRWPMYFRVGQLRH